MRFISAENFPFFILWILSTTVYTLGEYKGENLNHRDKIHLNKHNSLKESKNKTLALATNMERKIGRDTYTNYLVNN